MKSLLPAERALIAAEKGGSLFFKGVAPGKLFTFWWKVILRSVDSTSYS